MSETNKVKGDEGPTMATTQASTKAEEKPNYPAGDVPDPDEDDLDDLDDMLDDFSAVKANQNNLPKQPQSTTAVPPPAQPSSSGAAGAGDDALDGLLGDDEFAKQLQAGMADLLGELNKNPEMQAEFDNVFKSMAAAAEKAAEEDSKADQPAPASSTADAKATDASFQDTIRRTMERMQASGDQATAAAAESSTDDFLAEMMKQLGEGGGGLGEGGEEEFSKMLMGMMEQLTNKEILYEPMKELDDKFPKWLETNGDKTTAEDLKRYQEQQVLVREIVAKFEESTYTDSNAADREYIVTRMQKMQDAGSPPSDLVGDMASAQEAFNGPDMESCNPQ